jgi:hypothetical protein
VPITARWSDPATRKSPLVPYADRTEAQTLKSLEETFAMKSTHVVNDDVKAALKHSAERDVADLLPHLQARAVDLANVAKLKLSERGTREGAEMVKVLEAQRQRITETKKSRQQLELLGMTPTQVRDAERQFDAEKRYWDKRLGLIDNELVTEPARIRNVYDVKVSRVEPLGLIYLWPRS